MSVQIAEAIRNAIVSGDLLSDARLPSEAELAEQFGVSRPTVREALKRLAAQNLIRTRRGATGGNFVNRITWSEAHPEHAGRDLPYQYAPHYLSHLFRRRHRRHRRWQTCRPAAFGGHLAGPGRRPRGPDCGAK